MTQKLKHAMVRSFLMMAVAKLVPRVEFLTLELGKSEAHMKGVASTRGVSFRLAKLPSKKLPKIVGIRCCAHTRYKEGCYTKFASHPRRMLVSIGDDVGSLFTFRNRSYLGNRWLLNLQPTGINCHLDTPKSAPTYTEVAPFCVARSLVSTLPSTLQYPPRHARILRIYFSTLLKIK